MHKVKNRDFSIETNLVHLCNADYSYTSYYKHQTSSACNVSGNLPELLLHYTFLWHWFPIYMLDEHY